MVQAVRKRVRVQAGGVVSVQDASLPEGAEAEVIVLLDEAVEAGSSEEPPPLESMFGAAKGVFSTPEEAKQYVRELRDEPPPLPLTEIIGSGKGLFATPEEVDQYIRDLRDEWD